MQLRVKFLKLLAGRPVAILHEKTAERLDIHVDERILIKKSKFKIIAVVDLAASGLLKEKEIVISAEIEKYLNLKSGEKVEVIPALKPKSIEYIMEKMSGKKLDYNKLYCVVSDIVNNALTESEIAYFVSAVYMKDMNVDEIVNLTKAMVATGKKLGLKSKIIADKHAIGGIAGNRTTPIIVPICAVAGLVMPKTSSRAITSAAGTADTMETITNVDLNIEAIRKIVKKTNACIVWGGALGLAPADDKLIHVERILNLDPEAQLIASILAKKLSVGATHILIDIPYGTSAKVSKEEALRLEKRFQKVAKKLKLNIQFVLTNGEQPIGRGIGPVLEMLDILAVLRQEDNRPLDLEKKAVYLSSLILEMTKKAKKGKGIAMAEEILKTGKAYKKFIQIVKAQDGKNIHKQLKLGEFKKDILAEKTGKIISIDNKKIAMIARTSGCPVDKSSGIYIEKKCGDAVKKNEKILTIYSENKEKLRNAIQAYKYLEPILITN